MKKIFFVIFVACISFYLIGCGKTEYSGKYSHLYTEAVNSVPWLNGYSSTADRYCEPLIDILETDAFGRVIFTYYEHYYLGGPISFSSLLVCQFYDDDNVYYYEDVNFVMKEERTYSTANTEFAEEDIDKLKKANDWNMEINYDRCIEKRVVKSKEKLKYEAEVKDYVVNSLSGYTKNQTVSLKYLTHDSTGTKLLVYGCIKSETDTYFIGLIEIDSDRIKNFYSLVPSNIFDVQEEVINFKNNHNWY